jgi:hypothetical protein
MLTDRNGSGIKEYQVNVAFTLNMIGITIRNKVIRLAEYIMAGPTYILTLLTSSEILFMISPVLFLL